jgi:hypothetical protein
VRNYSAIHNLAGGGDQDVEVASERHVLKSVIQQVNRRTEHPLGNHAGKVAIVSDANHGLCHLARKHHRLVA